MPSTFVEVAERFPELLDCILTWILLPDTLPVSQANVRLCEVMRKAAARMLLEEPIPLRGLNDDPSSEVRTQRILALARQRRDDVFMCVSTFEVVVRLQLRLDRLRLYRPLFLGVVIRVLLEHLDIKLSGDHRLNLHDRVCRDALALLLADEDSEAALLLDVSRVVPYLQMMWRRDMQFGDLDFQWLVATLYHNARAPPEVWQLIISMALDGN